MGMPSFLVSSIQMSIPSRIDCSASSNVSPIAKIAGGLGSEQHTTPITAAYYLRLFLGSFTCLPPFMSTSSHGLWILL